MVPGAQRRYGQDDPVGVRVARKLLDPVFTGFL